MSAEDRITPHKEDYIRNALVPAFKGFASGLNALEGNESALIAPPSIRFSGVLKGFSDALTDLIDARDYWRDRAERLEVELKEAQDGK